MRAIIWVVLSAMIVLLDQFSKYWVNHHLYPGQVLHWLPFFNLTLRYNAGAAFSFLSTAGHWHVYFLRGVSVLVSIVLIVWLCRFSARRYGQAVAVSLILGGAVGNLINRVFQGYVTDMFDFHIGTWHFATFNVADSAVTIGTIVLVWVFVRQR